MHSHSNSKGGKYHRRTTQHAWNCVASVLSGAPPHMHCSLPLGRFLALFYIVMPFFCLMLGPFLPPSQVGGHWIHWPHLEPCRWGGRRMVLRLHGPLRSRWYGAQIRRKNKRTRSKKIPKAKASSMLCPHHTLERNGLLSMGIAQGCIHYIYIDIWFDESYFIW